MEMERSYSDLRCGWYNYKVRIHLFENEAVFKIDNALRQHW